MNSLVDKLYSGKVLLMDGAMGSELQRAGLADSECPELWNLQHPERVRRVHQAYVDAGADCLLTNTFQASKPALKARGSVRQLDAIQKAAIDLARSVAGRERYVFADIGPLAEVDGLEPRDLESLYPETESIDALFLETWSDPVAFFVVKLLRIAGWCEPLPIFVSFTFRRQPDGQLVSQSGHPPEWFAAMARQYDVTAIGVNCGLDIGMDEIIEIVRRFRSVTELPIVARPNAGTPVERDGQWVYPRTPTSIARKLPELLDAGVAMVGGCCGVGPEYIAAMRPIIDDWNAGH
ncbi:MAG: hypothetical protein KatS3mg105_0934 [Gemmatales bacterium]|nr:MAG: hypothetical protein KatS3mg105_0934 [Gemmatales bacterium]